MFEACVARVRHVAWVGVLLAGAAHAGSPRASSELRSDDGVRHGAALAFDGLLGTGWAEGEMGDGTGAWLELPLDREVEVRSISIWPGNMALGARSLREYGRPRKVTVTLSGAGDEVSVESVLLDPGERGPLRHDIEIEGKARKIRIDLDEVRPGGIYNDTFIAEVAVNFTQGEAPGTVDRLRAWLDSDRGKAALEKNREEVIALYEKVKAEEEGYAEAFKELMDRAGDGAPFLRRQVVSLVPAGFRVSALPPDEVAVEALLKLKDSNAIPAIERAALRSRGPEARRLRAQVEVFHAYQDLVGGGRFNIPPWGSTGWEKGALQGRGEPLSIEVDRYGDLYVADTANNRVQKFGPNGVVAQQWGHPEPGIVSRWFTDSAVTAYVAGSQPGEKEGEFSTPVDLARIPTKDGDRIGVLDARGWVTIIDESGGIAAHFKAPVEAGIIPGVGGEGHLEYTPKGGGKLAVVWGNEGWVFSLDGEELGHFDLEDGSPSGAVMLKNGKLGLIYGPQLVMYSLDGFRHGDLMRGALGEGFESWDIAVDHRGKYWAVTDKGELFKLKRPGVVDYKVQVSEVSLTNPRLAVLDDVAYITNDDEIQRVDALELKAKQELAEAEAAAVAAPPDGE